LDRPGSHALGVVVALGVGVMLLTTVAVLERALARHLDLDRRPDAPTFFFVDVQPDQAEAFRRLVASADGGAAPDLVPVVRARLAAINDRPSARAEWEGRAALERVRGVLEQVAAAMRAVGLFVVGGGVVVMRGALASSRYRRLAESVLLRTLAAPRGLVLRSVAVEYGCLGLAGGLAGAFL